MTMISINKNTNNKKPVNPALLAMGTASHAWFDDESESVKQMSKDAVIALIARQHAAR